MTHPEENQFDDLLRGAFKGFRSEPDASVWPGIEATLRPQPLTRWQRLRPLGAGVLLGALLMGLVPHDTATPASRIGEVTRQAYQVPARLAASAPSSEPEIAAPAPGLPHRQTTPVAAPFAAALARSGTFNAVHSHALSSLVLPTSSSTASAAPIALTATLPAGAVASPVLVPALLTSSASVTEPTPSLAPSRTDSATHPVPTATMIRPWRTGFALDTALHAALDRQALPERPADSSPDTVNKARIRGLLLAEAAVLRALTQRNDSLLLTLEAPAVTAVADSAVRPSLPPPRPWGVMVATELMNGWGTLPGYDEHTTEKLGASRAVSLSLTRQLTDRWRLRTGVGEAVVQTQLRSDRERHGQTVYFDTTRTTDIKVHDDTDTTFIIRVTTMMHLEPRLNNIGQVIGYDTSYIPIRDTTFQVIISHDTLRTNQTVVTRRVDTWRERRQQQLRPEYRFWTLPFAGQYALLVRGRLRLGLSAGGQVMFFRGGTRPVLRGEEYTLERVGPKAGPFRPISLAWQGSADVEWRFSSHLSATVAPGLRGWAIRPERGLNKATRPLPSVQVGFIWGF
jgi:hypothetical protein